MNEQFKFWLRKEWNETKIIFLYFLKEPFIEIKQLSQGYYNSVLLFWASVILYIMMIKKNVIGVKLKIALFLIIITYFYMFSRSEKWKEYYKKEYIEGDEIK